MSYRKTYKNVPIFTVKDGKSFLLVLLILMFASWRQEMKKPLISPIVDIPVAYADELTKVKEIKKEDTRWWRLYQKIRWVESNNGTKGLAVTCSKKGKINEIGYLPTPGFCFNSEWEQELTISNWMNKRINYDDMSDSQLLCLWNTGKAYTSCAYSRGELSKAN